MFKFMHGGVVWRVEFSHTKHDPPQKGTGQLGKEFLVQASTKCDIWRQEQEVDEASIVSSREAMCLVGDRWRKSIGRGIALRRALSNCKLVKVDTPPPEWLHVTSKWEPLFTRDFRRLVWACYWVMSNRLDRVTGTGLGEAVVALGSAGTKIPPLRVYPSETPAMWGTIKDLVISEPKEQNVQG